MPLWATEPSAVLFWTACGLGVVALAVAVVHELFADEPDEEEPPHEQ